MKWSEQIIKATTLKKITSGVLMGMIWSYNMEIYVIVEGSTGVTTSNVDETTKSSDCLES